MAEHIPPAVAETPDGAGNPRTGCYVCRFHGGELGNGHVRCGLPDGRTMGYTARGCCYWEREPGADDE